VPKLLSCCCSLLTTPAHVLFGPPFAHSSPYPPPIAILILVSDFWFLGLAFYLAFCSLPLIPVQNVWEHEDGCGQGIRRETREKKNQQCKPIHQKYKTNENTRRHNPKKKQKQTINNNKEDLR
jgi:hypothetical protein